MCQEERIFSKIFNMFVWMSGFQKSLAHTDFNMFVDQWTSANESPDPESLLYPCLGQISVYLNLDPI